MKFLITIRVFRARSHVIGLLLRIAVLVAAIFIVRMCNITWCFRSCVRNLTVKVIHIQIFLKKGKKERGEYEKNILRRRDYDICIDRIRGQ